MSLTISFLGQYDFNNVNRWPIPFVYGKHFSDVCGKLLLQQHLNENHFGPKERQCLHPEHKLLKLFFRSLSSEMTSFTFAVLRAENMLNTNVDY